MRSKRISQKVLPVLCVCVLLFALFAPAAAAKEPMTVRVGYMLMEDFQEEETIFQDGKEVTVRSGYGYEYLQVVRYYAGWDYEYVHGTWGELLEMLEQGEIDLLGYVGRTEEREGTMLFSMEPQGSQTHFLYVDGPSEAIDPNDYSTINGKNIGAITGDFRTGRFLNWCQDKGITCNIREYPDMQAIHTAIHSGEIHAVSASSMNIASCPDGKWNAIIHFEDAPTYFATTRSARGEAILKEVNNAQKHILAANEDYSQDLYRKYISQIVPPAKLTQEEQLCLQERGTLRVGYCDTSRPISYTNDKGEVVGLVAEYLAAMTKEYKMRFEALPYPNDASLQTALQNGEVDIIAPVSYGHGMAEIYGMAITAPLTEETMLAVYRGYKGTETRDIFKRIAVLEDSINEKEYVRQFYPDTEVVQVNSVEEALNLVSEEKVGCYILPSSNWSWQKNEYERLNDLQVLTLPNTSEIHMVIRDEDIQLLPILNKGVELLREADVDQIIVAHSDAMNEMTWLKMVQRKPIAATLGIVATLLLIAVLLMLYRLSTEKKYLEQLKVANEKAEKARLEAERANQAKSTFLTSMSHDIRTPMNAIVGMTTLAAKHLNNPDYVRNCLSKVNLASDHLLTLINDVLDINKIESGNLSLTPSVFSLADSIMNLANIGRHQLQEKNHHFEIRVHNIAQEYLFADELRINQVFINLLSNAVKYTPAGGRITIDLQQEPVPGERNKIRLIYVIEDTGIGMSEEFQTHMYDLFAMANKSARTLTGSGVGLSICKQLVDLMGGDILCESEEGKGTRFTVALNLEIADRIVDHVMLPPMKILLVDDDEVFLTTAAETLQELGVSPDCVDSGEKAVAVVKEKHAEQKDYPLIIIDWQMPEMDGIETTRRIRTEVGPDVSIIVISAYALEDIRDEAIAAGANGFIHKPFFRNNAYQSISEIMGLNYEQMEIPYDSHQKVKGMHLLIAEDNDLNWEIIHELLAMYEVTAVRAENGQRCVEMLEQSRPGEYGCVLMDIQMPVMNGYDAAAAIRNMDRGDLRSVPIIAMTADAYTEDVLRCAQAGMNGHIPKPIDMERLLETLSGLKTL